MKKPYADWRPEAEAYIAQRQESRPLLREDFLRQVQIDILWENYAQGEHLPKPDKEEIAAEKIWLRYGAFRKH